MMHKQKGVVEIVLVVVFLVVVVVVVLGIGGYLWLKGSFPILHREGLCMQVISAAKNPITGRCLEFATPCDIPVGWEILDGTVRVCVLSNFYSS